MRIYGRTLGDSMRQYTLFHYSSSVIGHFVAPENLLSLISYFQAYKNLPDLSNHCQISCMVQSQISLTVPSVAFEQSMPDKYNWYENSLCVIQEANSSP